MLYKRSSFISWLKHVKDCDIIPIEDTRAAAFLIKNGIKKAYLGYDPNDEIDYEEIWEVCQKLWIVGLPGESDLKEFDK